MKQKLSLVLASSVLALSATFYSLASASEKELIPVNSGEISGYVYLNGEPIKENTTVYATENNQEELIEKYGLEKPSESAKLVSIQIVNNEFDNPRDPVKEQDDSISPQNIWGFKLVNSPTQSVDGWTEIARGKYFCNKPKTQSCNGVEISIAANESVSVEVQTSLSIGVKEFVAAEFGRTLNEQMGVSTSVMVPMNVPGGKTGIGVGYPIYKSTYGQVYQKGLFVDTLLGGATYLEPKPSSIAVTSWIQG
ncbi:hypothetical protein M3629_25020 [Paenibacillus polysaccharolyticus]|uniref:hypothetical protein n=1 Tax=Paenibacillus polysaccharolyticus TaxID=582692 RepID=UPI00203AE149|nr:hypothetical protein [Paenibacillus polysaccharolyticus]MCM3136037.1 hypothetical protein [Paenibacillus polysaccharolyticus]